MGPFALHSVLNYRGQLEELAQQKLRTAEQAARQLAERISKAETEIAAAATTLAEKQRQEIDIREHIRLEEGLDYQRRELAALKEAMVKRQQSVDNARGHLQKRSQEKKVMEKLKERQDSAWQLHLSKKEAADIDEIAILYHGKK